MASPWRKLPVSMAELCIDTTLRCGQSFRWRKFGDVWRCSLAGRIISLKQDDEAVYYQSLFPSSCKLAPDAKARSDDTGELLHRYFNLQVDLGALYDQWSRVDANFSAKAPRFSGIRILNQDAWEALLCFICSSNNNIARISQMSHKLCLAYGPFLGEVDGEAYHDMPTPNDLAVKGVEDKLRQLGFGYRAKYIAQTAQALANDKPADWLQGLRDPASVEWPGRPSNFDSKMTYKDARQELLSLSGVGPKVSDCVCLMGLGWAEAVPVDTHVWQIAVRDYKFKNAAKGNAAHDAVSDHFRELWGEYAGWAQSVLFTANLRSFSDQLKGSKTVKDEVMSLKKEESVEALLNVKEEATPGPKEEATPEPEVLSRTRKRKIKVEETVVVATTRRRARK